MPALLLAALLAAGGPPPLRLGTATPGGGFERFGAALVAAVREGDPSLTVEPLATKGSTENLARLRAGALDLGLVTGEVAHQALAGPRPEVRVLSVMYPSPGLLAVRAGSPWRRLQELRGKRVVFGARGSGLVVLARLVLDGLGLDLERDFEAVLLDRAEDGPALVLSGQAEALWGGGAAWPGFAALASAPGGARFLAPDAAEVKRIVERHPFLRPLALPAGAYPGQAEPVASVGSWSLVLVRADLPEEVAYRLARALHRAAPLLRERLPQAAEASASNTARAVAPGELHPGAARWLRELGLLGEGPAAR